MGNNASKTIDVGGVPYGVERVLGKGAYGKVHVLFPPKGHPNQSPIYALKRMDKSLILGKGARTVAALKFEKHILSKMQHPFLVNLHATMQNEDELFMVLDLMHGGDISYWLGKEHHFPEAQAKFYTCNILLSLRYFHKHGVLHRDIKPENIMLDAKGYAHLTDLNVCKPINMETGTAQGFAGSAAYMAAEIFRGEAYDSRADMWSVGVMLFEMVTGRVPWGRDPRPTTEQYLVNTEIPEEWHRRAKNDPDYLKMVKRITREKVHIPSSVSAPCKAFLKKLICNVERRYTVEEAIQDPWFSDINWDDMLAMNVPAPFVPDSEVANADVHFVFEDVMGPKAKKKALTDEEQAQFFDWDWMSSDLSAQKEAFENSLASPSPDTPKKGKAPKRRISTLLKSADAIHRRQQAFLESHPPDTPPDIIEFNLASETSAPLKAIQPVVRYSKRSKKKHTSSSSGTSDHIDPSLPSSSNSQDPK